MPDHRDRGTDPISPSPAQRTAVWAGGIVILMLVAIGVYAWLSLGDVEMSAAAYIALAMGVLGVAGLGGGLMALIFYSSRHGYDDAAGGKPDRD